MARRRITSFQPQAGSVSREVDILGRRGATDIINIGKKIRAQKEAERTFVQKTLDNIENLKEESALIHRTAFNSEIDNLKQNVFNAFAKKNKRGKVRGFDIYDPEIRNFVQSEVSRLNKLVSRSQPLVDEAEKAIKAINADNTIINKAEAVANVTDYMNDINSLISNKDPLVSFNEIVTASQDDELVVNSALAELTKNDEMSSKSFSKKEVIDNKNVTKEQRFDYNIDVIRIDGEGNRIFNDDKINEYTNAMILANPVKFNNENGRLRAKELVEKFFEPKSTIKEDIRPVTGGGSGSGTFTSKVFNAQSDIVNYEFDEIDKSKITLKGFNFTKPIPLRMKVEEDGVNLFKEYKAFGLRENIDGEKFVYAYTGKERISDLEKIIAQYDLKKLLTEKDELLTEEEKKTKKELKEKIDGLDKLHILTLNKAIEKDLIQSARSQGEQEESINIGGLEYVGENSLFTEDERVNTFDTSIFNDDNN